MAGFLLEFFLNFLVYVVGYVIADSLFPWISSGRIVVQPYNGEFFHGFYRDDSFGRIEIAAEPAAILGFLIFLAVCLASYFLLRAVAGPVPSVPRPPLLSGSSSSLPLDATTTDYLQSLSGN